jgi:hypothetical protein
MSTNPAQTNSKKTIRAVPKTLSAATPEHRIPISGSAIITRIECFAELGSSSITISTLSKNILISTFSQFIQDRIAFEGLKLPVSDFILVSRTPDSQGTLLVQFIIEEALT